MIRELHDRHDHIRALITDNSRFEEALLDDLWCRLGDPPVAVVAVLQQLQQLRWGFLHDLEDTLHFAAPGWPREFPLVVLNEGALPLPDRGVVRQPQSIVVKLDV